MTGGNLELGHAGGQNRGPDQILNATGHGAAWVRAEAKISIPPGEKVTAIVLLVHGMSSQPEIVPTSVFASRLGMFLSALGFRVELPHGGESAAQSFDAGGAFFLRKLPVWSVLQGLRRRKVAAVLPNLHSCQELRISGASLEGVM